MAVPARATPAKEADMDTDKMIFSFGQATDVPFCTTTAAFQHHVMLHPSAIAVHDFSASDSARQLTYGELASQAQALAWHLRSIGVEPNQRVPLVVKRSCEMIVGIWAILLCGAQYVPLDGGVVPNTTLCQVFEESGGTVVVCTAATEKRVQEVLPSAHYVNVEHHLDGRDAPGSNGMWMDLAKPTSGCYVIYTSGM